MLTTQIILEIVSLVFFIILMSVLIYQIYSIHYSLDNHKFVIKQTGDNKAGKAFEKNLLATLMASKNKSSISDLSTEDDADDTTKPSK